MALSQEEAENIKKQILKQIESWPEEQKAKAQEQIEAMSPNELEQFLIQNKMIKSGEGEEAESKPEGKQECIFCSIVQGKTSSYKLDENKSSLAILEISPLSKGHALVVSKEHNKLPNSAFSLANKLGRRIKSKFQRIYLWM